MSEIQRRLFRGLWPAQLSNDWRFRIPSQWSEIFGTRPIIVTLDEDGGPGWRFYPFYLAPLGWQDYLLTAFGGIEPPKPYTMTVIGSHDRLTVPVAVHRKTNVDRGIDIRVLGQATYIEVWPAPAWQKFCRVDEFENFRPFLDWDMPPLPYFH